MKRGIKLALDGVVNRTCSRIWQTRDSRSRDRGSIYFVMVVIGRDYIVYVWILRVLYEAERVAHNNYCRNNVLKRTAGRELGRQPSTVSPIY